MECGLWSGAVKDATLQAGQHFIIRLAASQMRSGLERPGNMEIKTGQWSGNSTNEGLIWEPECSSDSVETADSTLRRTGASVAHDDVASNGFSN